MRLMVIFTLMVVCLVLGTEAPLFFVGAYLLFVWLAVAMVAGGLRWLVGLTAPTPANADGPPAGGRRTRVCTDSRCGRVNIGHARFCAQCGRRLA